MPAEAATTGTKTRDLLELKMEELRQMRTKATTSGTRDELARIMRMIEEEKDKMTTTKTKVEHEKHQAQRERSEEKERQD